MTLPHFTMRQLLEAGVHFGHTTRRWNPKMAPYLFGVRNGIHIIDLEQTVPLLHQALVAVRDIVAAGGRVLFVGTKRQASDLIAESAKRCGQYYVNHRWLGGMMTNWKTISHSIKRLQALEDQLAQEEISGLTKKELLNLTRERDKLDRALGGIKEMGGLPDVLVVIDTNKEHIAVQEAVKLGMPVVGVVDSNSDCTGVTYPVPGNDDATRAIGLYCELLADAVLDGIQVEVGVSGGDAGEAAEGPQESLPAEGDGEPKQAEGDGQAPVAKTETKTETKTKTEKAADDAAPADEASPEKTPEKTAAETPEAASGDAGKDGGAEKDSAATAAAEGEAAATPDDQSSPDAPTDSAADAPADGPADASADTAETKEKAGA
jgi:small subunit ribosomal protein S2